MDLYDATGGDDWHYNDNWGSDLPLKEWYGIYTDRNGSVTAVVLDGNGLVGELPESIGDLGYIDIYLSSNGLSGEVPSSAFRVNDIDLKAFLSCGRKCRGPPRKATVPFMGLPHARPDIV